MQASLAKRLDAIESVVGCNIVDIEEKSNLLGDFSYFVSEMFRERMGSEFIMAPHHKVICGFMEKVFNGEIKRGIINISPGYTKTEICSISAIAYGIARNSRARFLHLSYSHALALQNSNMARTTINTDLYQSIFPRAMKDDTNAKEIWWTTDSGGVRATSSMGQVTGFRAGHMDHGPDNFTGALIIDDPVKPEDAYSEVMREGVNNNFNETISSRVAVEDVPIIVIMQRIHYNDLSGYLLRGGSGEKWHHLNLPVIIDNSKPYPEQYTHGIPYDHGLEDGWLWPFKHNEQHEVALKSHRRKFAAQYMQEPIERDEETALWPERLIKQARELRFKDKQKTIVSVDPATTNSDKSDEHGIVVLSRYKEESGYKYSVDNDYTRKGSPMQWAETAINAYNEHNADYIVIETNQGGDMCEATLRNCGFTGKIVRVTASKGKVLRAEPVAAMYEQGLVAHNTGLYKAENEMMDFDQLTGLSKGRSPNRVDAITHGLTELYQPEQVAMGMMIPKRLR